MDETAKIKLLGRAGFGVCTADLERYLRISYDEIVDELVAEMRAFPVATARFDPFEPDAAEVTWLERMMAGEGRLAEKLVLFWHGHFATSNRKVANMQLMWDQHEIFRRRGPGPFDELLVAVTKDPAMLLWLDNNSNRRSSPNENYARELLELFALGAGHYSERDIQELARALTGWGVRSGRFVEHPEHHDSGTKTIFGVSDRFDGEKAVRLVEMQPRCSEYISERLCVFFAGAVAEPSVLRGMTEAEATADKVHVLFVSEWFRRSELRVKSPVELLVGGLRELELESVPEWAPGLLAEMGQSLFYPPSVKGWDGGLSWLAAGSMLARFRVADRLSSDPLVARRLAGPAYQLT